MARLKEGELEVTIKSNRNIQVLMMVPDNAEVHRHIRGIIQERERHIATAGLATQAATAAATPQVDDTTRTADDENRGRVVAKSQSPIVTKSAPAKLIRGSAGLVPEACTEEAMEEALPRKKAARMSPKCPAVDEATAKRNAATARTLHAISLHDGTELNEVELTAPVRTPQPPATPPPSKRALAPWRQPRPQLYA